MEKGVRVRFAPSPTGGLHIGGVRTALFNYLFAKKHGGQFVLRIEDTDQTRYVEGAEEYIIQSLAWCGLLPDEGVHAPQHLGPYRQSERKEIYKKYANELVKNGYGYYAFDTVEELDAMRIHFKTNENTFPTYNHLMRMKMKNSLTLSESEVNQLLQNNIPYVIRLKVPLDEKIVFADMLRGEIVHDSNTVDDKVLLKADGMPTYHLAVVVDDFLMKITHAFRGEEWLPSAPIHVLLWQYLFGIEQMPQWAHFPLILKPGGNGKLSKRDGDMMGFPVFAMDWKDPSTGDITHGFKERGFLPQAFINMLVMLGWNNGTEQEIFSMEELITQFSIEKVHKSGAKFDFEKAIWFNHEWIKRISVAEFYPYAIQSMHQNNIIIDDDATLNTVIALVKDRCHYWTDFYKQAVYFFIPPTQYNMDAVRPKWSNEKVTFFNDFTSQLKEMATWNALDIEAVFKTLSVAKAIKPSEVQLPFRIMLVGDKYGPAVFDIAAIIGKEDTMQRIVSFLQKVMV